MFDSTLNLFLESAYNNAGVQGFGKQYKPDMEGIEEIRTENLKESFLLESAVLKASTQSTIYRSQGNLSEAVALQESVFTNIFDKIKALIIKMWNRIKDFFKSVKLFFDKLIMKESKFASTYKNEILKIASVEIEGYDVSPDALTVKACWDKAEALINTQKKFVEDAKKVAVAAKNGADASSEVDKIKGKLKSTQDLKDTIANDTVNATADSFKKEVLNKLGLDATTTVKYTGSDIHTILSGLSKNLSKISDDEKEANSAYKDAVKSVDEIAKNLKADENNKDKTAAYTVVKSMGTTVAGQCKELLNFVNTVAGARTTAYKTEASQAKKAAYKGMTDAKKKNVNESFDFDTFYNALIGR